MRNNSMRVIASEREGPVKRRPKRLHQRSGPRGSIIFAGGATLAAYVAAALAVLWRSAP
jgi:hypothetical protein